MRRLQFFFLCLVAIILTGNLPVEDVASQDRDAALDGTWEWASTDSTDGKGRLSGEGYSHRPTLVISGQDASHQWQGRLSVNSGARPKSVDFAGVEGYVRKVRYTGIYKIEGDILTICVVEYGRPRPSDFELDSRPNRMLHTYTRVHREKAK